MKAPPQAGRRSGQSRCVRDFLRNGILVLAFGGFDHNDNDEWEEVGRKQDHLRMNVAPVIKQSS